MKKISISIYSIQHRYGDREALRIAKEVMKADAVDFSLDDFGTRYEYRCPTSVYALPEEEFVNYFSSLKAYADELGLEICQTHGRGYGFRANKEEDDALIGNARLDCYATALLGAPVCVMHGVTTMFHMDASPEYMHEMNFEMFCRILPHAKRYGVKVATETFGDVHGGACCDFFGNIDEFIKTYERICAVDDFADHFTVCVDTGHSNKATKFNNNPKPAEVIRRLGKNVTCLHLNDNNTVGDQHLLPFVTKNGWPIDNTIDWDDTFAALEEIGYSGVYNMEISLNRYGEEIMPEFGAFIVTVMRNALGNRE